MLKSTIEDIEVAGRRVLLRVDFNVPLRKDGTISDESRIHACLPTINYLVERGGRVIICSHMDRPNGKVVPELSLKPVAERLSQLLARPVGMQGDCVGPEVESAVSQLGAGEIILLENLRFHSEEEANDRNFAQALAHLAEVYVDDAFGVSHRAHASVVGVAEFLPAVAGFLMAKELAILGKALENPVRPFAAVIGGAKVGGKLAVLENIVDKVNILLVGGGMVATFFKGLGYQVGDSPVESDKVVYVRELIARADSLGVRLRLPSDVIVTEKIAEGAACRTVQATDIPAGWVIADIGPQSVAEFSRELKRCRTVLWNGPMGVFEIGSFAEGTKQLAEVLAELDATTIIGGGSTAEAVVSLGFDGKMSHVSTGGGASLEFLKGKMLPGVAVLKDKP
ncbi:MAG: phosphoglycerate kinase [Dehalococcoidales bacterium]|jgi:phosphoglycerate kinase